jgi:hypothetical protein
MENRINTNKIIRSIHLYSAFLIALFLLIHILSGFILNYPDLIHPPEIKTDTTRYALELPAGITNDELPGYVRDEFRLRGHLGKPQTNKAGETSIFYFSPGVRYLAVISADKKNIRINTMLSNSRFVVTIFHRMTGYGGGFFYDLYMLMTDLTGIGVILFAITGVWIAFSKKKDLIPKLVVFCIGMGYTIAVIVSFMKS